MNERIEAGKVVDKLYAEKRKAWEKENEYEPGDHPYGHYRRVAIDLQIELDRARGEKSK